MIRRQSGKDVLVVDESGEFYLRSPNNDYHKASAKDIIKYLQSATVPLAKKVAHYPHHEIEVEEGLTELKDNVNEAKNIFIEFVQCIANYELWHKTLRYVESKYGSSVSMYFLLIKWMIMINVVSFLPILGFSILPQLFIRSKPENYVRITGDCSPNCSVVQRCTTAYMENTRYNITVTYEEVYKMLSGEGLIENTMIFIGWYYPFIYKAYNASVMYSLSMILFLVISFFCIITRVYDAVRKSKLLRESSTTEKNLCSTVFTSWDYSIKRRRAAVEKKGQVFLDLFCGIDRLENIAKKKAMTKEEWYRIYLIRWSIHVGIFVSLILNGYIIYESHKASVEHSSMFYNYLPQIVMTIIGELFPRLYLFLSKYEKYSKEKADIIGIIRIIVLRITSIGYLYISIFLNISCKRYDECNMGVKPCRQRLACWETLVGQEFYKLCISYYYTVILKLCWEAGKKYLARYIKFVESPSFSLPEDTLELVILQMSCWCGTPFCPFLPIMTILACVQIYYFKRIAFYHLYTVCHPYQALKADIVIALNMLSSYMMSLVPTVYIFSVKRTSKSCGPFRIFTSSIHVISYPIYDFILLIREHTGRYYYVIVLSIIIIIISLLVYLAMMAYIQKTVITGLRRRVDTTLVEKTYLKKRMKSARNDIYHELDLYG